MSSMPPPPGGDQTGYQSAPAYQSGPMSGAPAMTSPPASIINAKYAMWAGAVMQLLTIPVTLLMLGEMREVIEESLRESGQTYDEAIVDFSLAVGVGFALVLSVLGAALWFLMAFLTVKGKGWARIVATVLYVIYVLYSIGGLVQPSSMLALALSIIVLIIGAVATFFLWRKDSTAWFKAHKAPTV